MNVAARISIALLCTMALSVSGQDYQWWNNKHQWDGYSSWTEYLIISPSYLGPNALPVPEVRKGSPPGEGFFRLGVDGHYHRGGRTGNLYSRFFTPLFSPRVGLNLSYVPVEVYRTDTLTRDLRRSREYDARGISFGDLYVGMCIHLVQEDDRVPDIMLSLHLKTASGTRLEAARHTDAPGYYVDLSAGKSLSPAGKFGLTRIYGMVGFYAYQTYLTNYLQNDAVLYGTGFDIKAGRFHMEHQLGGYAGYLDNGDRPLVYRLSLRLDLQSPFTPEFRFQRGLNDFPFTSLRISASYRFL